MNSKHILLCAVALFCGANLNATWTAQEYAKDVDRTKKQVEESLSDCFNGCEAMAILLSNRIRAQFPNPRLSDVAYKCLSQCHKRHLKDFEVLEEKKRGAEAQQLAKAAQEQSAAVSAPVIPNLPAEQAP